MSTYLDRFKADLVLRDLQPTTRSNYLWVVGCFAEHVDGNVFEATADDVREYLLEVLDRTSPASVRLHRAALRFLFVHTLGRPDVMDAIPRVRYRGLERLPEVPTPSEVQQIFRTTWDPFYRALFQTTYATGLRSQEVRYLTVQDVRSAEGVLFVSRHNTKGRKDRLAPLCPLLLELLREHWRRHRPPGPYLFPARTRHHDPALRRFLDHPVAANSATKMLRRVSEAAGVSKRVTMHTLRHAFATHLLEQGVGMYPLQLLLGHASPSSTRVYAHVRTDVLRRLPSPLELLPK